MSSPLSLSSITSISASSEAIPCKINILFHIIQLGITIDNSVYLSHDAEGTGHSNLKNKTS